MRPSRRRPAAAGATARRGSLGAVLATLAAVVLLAGCGSSSVPPASGAARVVPADALAYLHVSLDATRSAVSQATASARRFPLFASLTTALHRRLSAIVGANYASAIAPWIGTEAGVAVVPLRGQASELIVLRVGAGHGGAARAFVATHHRPAAARGDVAAALIGGYVVIGQPAVLSAARRAAATRTDSLAGQAAYVTAQAAAPADRVLDAWATGTGVRELLGGHGGVAGILAGLGNSARALSAQVIPTGDGFRIRVLLSGRAGTAHSFTPTLVGRLPAATTWVADMASLTGSAPGLLGALGAGTAGTTGATHAGTTGAGTAGTTGAGGAGTTGAGGASVSGQLIGRLGSALRAEGVTLAPLESLFAHESAIFGLDAATGVMTRVSNMAAARAELGRAGAGLAQLFGPAASASQPVVSTRTVAGVHLTEWDQGGAQIDTAVFSHLAVITDDPAALIAVIRGGTDTLSGSSLYQSVLAGVTTATGPVLFGAINRLVRRGGQTGLLESFGLQGATSSLARIRAAGLASTGGAHETTAELYFTIS